MNTTRAAVVLAAAVMMGATRSPALSDPVKDTFAMAGSATSSGIIVQTSPDTTALWRTAWGNVVQLPVVFPRTATSAELSVTGDKYARSYSNVGEGDFTLTLPEPTSLADENVYELTLSFDDGTVRRAKIGVVRGAGTAGEGVTRCVLDSAIADWRTFRTRAVIPIPYGTTMFTVDDTAVDTGLGGAAGWYALAATRVKHGGALAVAGDGIDWSAYLIGIQNGTTLLFK